MPTFTLSTIAQASGRSFVALPGKRGQAVDEAERQADALDRLSRAALPGVALAGQGAMQEFPVVTLVEIFSSLPHRQGATVATGAHA